MVILMHEIHLEDFNCRTDMIIDNNNSNIHNHKKIVTETIIKNNKLYKTISFKDITDKDNFNEVLKKTTITIKYFIYFLIMNSIN